MEQATFEGLLNSFQGQIGNSINELQVGIGRMDMPVVVLVHGIGGNARHWSDPISLSVGETWLFNVASKPADGNGLVSSPPYKKEEVTTWTQILQNNNISFVNFSQGHPTDLIEFAVAELITILKELEQSVFAPFEQDVAANGGQVPPLIILCHSRGGLVTRHTLKQLGKEGVPHLKKVITLCTPHLGSYLPRFADDYNRTLHNQLEFRFEHHVPVLDIAQKQIENVMTDLTNKIREALLRSTGGMAQSPGFNELNPDSPVFQALVQDEQPLPGVEYHGYGGSNPNFMNYYLMILGQKIEVLQISGSFLLELFAKITGLEGNYGGLAELKDGDSMVSLTSSVWPAQFNATHEVLHINHMQALIDRPLQENVVQLMLDKPLQNAIAGLFKG